MRPLEWTVCECPQGSAGRVKGGAKAASARVRVEGALGRRSPSRAKASDQDEVAAVDGAAGVGPSTRLRPQMHAAPLPPSARFRSISPKSPGLGNAAGPDQESGVPLPSWLEGTRLKTPEVRPLLRSLNTAQPLSPTPAPPPASAEARTGAQNAPAPSLAPTVGDAKLSPQPKSLRDTDDKGRPLGRYKQGDLKNSEGPTKSVSSRDDEEKRREPGYSGNVQNVRFDKNVGGDLAPITPTVDADAYKSVLSAMKKQNDAFQESWKRMEERLDRLESALSTLRRRREPSIEGDKEEPWDFSKGFVVNEAESLDLIVDLSSVDHPVVAKSLLSAKGIVKPSVTATDDDTVREWVSKGASVSSTTAPARLAVIQAELKNKKAGENAVQDQNNRIVGAQYERSEVVIRPFMAAMRGANEQVDPAQEPRLEQAARSADNESQRNQRFHWQTKSEDTFQSATPKPSRRKSPHSPTERLGLSREVNDPEVQKEKVARRRFRFGTTRDSENRSQDQPASASKRLMRKKEEKRGTNFKFPSCLYIGKLKGKSSTEKNESGKRHVFKSEENTAEESTEKDIGVVNPVVEQELKDGCLMKLVENQAEVQSKESGAVKSHKHENQEHAPEDAIDKESCTTETPGVQDNLEEGTAQGDTSYRVFWFEGSKQFVPIETGHQQACSGQGRSGLESWVWRDKSKGSSNGPAKVHANRSSAASSPANWKAGPDYKENRCDDDWEARRRRKALKNRLRAMSNFQSSHPSVGLQRNQHQAPGSYRTESPARILRKRLDASPLRNPKLANMGRSSRVVQTDSIQTDCYSPGLKTRNMENVKRDRQRTSSATPEGAASVSKSGVAFNDEIASSKLTAENSLVEMVKGPGEELNDGHVSSEDSLDDRGMATEENRASNNRGHDSEDPDSESGPSPAEQSTTSVSFLRRLSSHSLEDLILKGCKSADIVLNVRLDEEIAALGVAKEGRPGKEKFVDKLVRHLKGRRNEETCRFRSRPAAADADVCDPPSRNLGSSDRPRRHKLIRPLQTEPAHRHFRQHRQRHHKDETGDKRERGVLHRLEVIGDSEATGRQRPRDNGTAPEDLSGLISLSKRDGKMVETFLFNPLWAPGREKNPNTADIISKLFPSSRANSAVQVESTLKVRTQDGRTYEVDSEPKLPPPSRVHPGASVKLLKEKANQAIAAKCLSDSSCNDYNELYTVFSEKIYFPSGDDKTDCAGVHIETIRISYPVEGRDISSEKQYCKSSVAAGRGSRKSFRKWRRRKRSSDGPKWDAADATDSDLLISEQAERLRKPPKGDHGRKREFSFGSPAALFSGDFSLYH